MAKNKKMLGNGGFVWKEKGSRSRKTTDGIEKVRNTGTGITAKKKMEDKKDAEDLVREFLPKKSLPVRCGECGQQCKSQRGLNRHRIVSV